MTYFRNVNSGQLIEHKDPEVIARFRKIARWVETDEGPATPEPEATEATPEPEEKPKATGRKRAATPKATEATEAAEATDK